MIRFYRLFNDQYIKKLQKLDGGERLDFASTCISENSWIFIYWKSGVLFDS